jgi:cation diffusion facilitator CzcD-associated flavoprotein CzcO
MTETSTREYDVDVLIVGAGVSGIGAATRLARELPFKTFLVVDARENIGGTWDLMRFPGIRSDSDLITYGYEYKPWTHKQAIAPGGAILDYLREAITEHDLESRLRLGRQVLSADWSSADCRWTVSMRHTATGAVETLTARWLFSATGYYDHAAGYRPTFPGEDEFAGRIVHPQEWPEDLDYAGKQVVVIGSGATALTVVPAMTDQAAHVTMLQRSPSYVLPMPSKDLVFCALKPFVSTHRAFRMARRANIARLRAIIGFSHKHPAGARRVVRWLNKASLPKGYDVDTHFKPAYNPWDERMCLVPDGDFFRTIKAGKASVVTDQIARFTRDGIELASGQVLPADVVVTATGMNLLPFGRIDASVDGVPVNWADTVTFRSMMLSGIPNFVYAFGYTNNSWTLKVDLVTEHWCRLLRHMDEQGSATVIPQLDDQQMELRPFIADLNSGYIQRGIAAFPRQGTSGPWAAEMSYQTDLERLHDGAVTDDALVFSPAARPVPVAVG